MQEKPSIPFVPTTISSRDTIMYTVKLDGEDVSHRCFYADSEKGYVALYLSDPWSTAPTSRWIINDVLAHEIKFGKVEIEYYGERNA